MALKEITKKVVSYCEIPEGIIPESHWINENSCDSYVEVHLEVDPDQQEELDLWIIENYPELIDEESFFIHLDY